MNSLRDKYKWIKKNNFGFKQLKYGNTYLSILFLK